MLRRASQRTGPNIMVRNRESGLQRGTEATKCNGFIKHHGLCRKNSCIGKNGGWRQCSGTAPIRRAMQHTPLQRCQLARDMTVLDVVTYFGSPSSSIGVTQQVAMRTKMTIMIVVTAEIQVSPSCEAMSDEYALNSKIARITGMKSILMIITLIHS